MGAHACACKFLPAMRTRRKLWASPMFIDQHGEAWAIIRTLARGSWTLLGSAAEFAAQLAAAEHLKRDTLILGLVSDTEASETEARLFTLDEFVKTVRRYDRESSVLGLGRM